MAYNIVTIVGSIRKGELVAQDRQCAGQARAGFAEARRHDAPGHFLLQPGSRSAPPADWLRLPREAAEVERRAVRDPEYNRSIPGVLKNAIDVGLAALWQELVPRQAGRHRRQLAPGPRSAASARCKHLQNILPGIAGPILGQPEIYLNGVGDAFDDKGELTKEVAQGRAAAISRRLRGLRRNRTGSRPSPAWSEAKQSIRRADASHAACGGLVKWLAPLALR